MSVREPILGVTPPDGAAKVRLQTVWKRRGNTPVITCEVLTQDAVQSAIDASESLGKYLRAYAKDLGLGPEPPWSVKAELQFLGSDNGAIDSPTEVEFLFFGPGGKVAQDPIAAALLRVIESQERIAVAREQTRQVELTTEAQVRQAEIQAIREACTAGVKEAAGEAAKLLQAGAAPLQDSLREQGKWFEHERTRADDATKDVATLLQRTAVPQVTWVDQAGKLAPLVMPIVNHVLKN